jgi:hypothetical protein
MLLEWPNQGTPEEAENTSNWIIQLSGGYMVSFNRRGRSEGKSVMTAGQSNQQPSQAGRIEVGGGGRSDRRNRGMLLLIERSAKLTQNPALWIQIRGFDFATFVLIVSGKWKRDLIKLTLKFSCSVSVLDDLLFSLYIIFEQNAKDCPSTGERMAIQ